MPVFFRSKRRRREAQITEHVDGALDAAGERELAAASAESPELAREVAEHEAVAALLRAQPDVPAPRSFALDARVLARPAEAPRRAPLWPRLAAAAAVLALAVVAVGEDATWRDPTPSDQPGYRALSQAEMLAEEGAPVDGGAPEAFAAEGAMESLAADEAPAAAMRAAPLAEDAADPTATPAPAPLPPAETAGAVEEAADAWSFLRRAQWVARGVLALLVVAGVAWGLRAWRRSG